MHQSFYTQIKFIALTNRKVWIAFFAIGLFFSAPLLQAQDLVDIDVEINRVEWAGDVYCADGISEHLPPLPPICIDLGNGPDLRFRYKVGVDGANYSGYKHIGAENSPQQGGPVLEDESDTDGANISSSAHNIKMRTICGSNLTFDLDAWDEDVAIQGFPCPLNGNYVYNSSYPSLCNLNLDGNDDARSTAIKTVAIPSGTSAVTTSFGNYVMKWTVTSTPVAEPTIDYGDYEVCTGTSATFIANPSTIGVKEYAWFTDLNDPLGSTEHIGDDFTTSAITSFPATYYVAQHLDGCYGAAKTLTVTESTENCGECVAPDFLYAYNINWTAVTLGWNEVPNATKYQMEGNIKGLRFLKCTKTTTVNGLQANNMFPFLTYEFRIRAQCPETGWTAWSAYEEFQLNPINTSNGRLPGSLPHPSELETVKFIVDGVFVAGRDAEARTITVGYYGNELLKEGTLIMTDISGRQIYTSPFELTPANIKQIHTSDISDGIYFISLYKDGILMETEKVLVY